MYVDSPEKTWTWSNQNLKGHSALIFSVLILFKFLILPVYLGMLGKKIGSFA